MAEIGEVNEKTWFFRNVVRRRVAWGALVAIVYLALARPTRGSVFVGAAIAVAGEALRTWASGTIVKREILCREGPYSLTRNPLYLGSFLIACGIGVMGNRPWLALALLAFLAAVYRPLVLKEEKRMFERHGEAFAAYCREVPRFLPRWAAWTPGPSAYDPRRMWSVHREWMAWVGLYGATLMLLLRSP